MSIFTLSPGLIPRLGISPGEGNGYPFQYSSLENSEEPSRLQFMGSQRVGHHWATNTHTHTHTHAHIIPDTNVKQFKGTKLNKFQTLVIRSSKYMAQINQETSKQQFYHYISGKYSMGIFYEFCQWTHHVRQCSPHWSWINGIFKLIPIIVDNIFEKHNENES